MNRTHASGQRHAYARYMEYWKLRQEQLRIANWRRKVAKWRWDHITTRLEGKT